MQSQQTMQLAKPPAVDAGTKHSLNHPSVRSMMPNQA